MISEDDLRSHDKQQRRIEMENEEDKEPAIKKPCLNDISASIDPKSAPAQSYAEGTPLLDGKIGLMSESVLKKGDSGSNREGLLSLLSNLMEFHMGLVNVPLDNLELHSKTSSGQEHVLFGRIPRYGISSSAHLTEIMITISMALINGRPLSREESKRIEHNCQEMMKEWSKFDSLIGDPTRLKGSVYQKSIENTHACLSVLKRDLGMEPNVPLEKADFSFVSNLLSSHPLYSALIGNTGLSNGHIDASSIEHVPLLMKHYIRWLAPSLNDFIHCASSDKGKYYSDIGIYFNTAFKTPFNPSFSQITVAATKFLNFSIKVLNNSLMSFIRHLAFLHLGSPSIAHDTSQLVKDLQATSRQAVLEYLHAFGQFSLPDEHEHFKEKRYRIIMHATQAFVRLSLSENHQLNIDEDTMRSFFSCFPPQWISFLDSKDPQELLVNSVEEIVKKRQVDFPLKKWNNDMDVPKLFGALIAWNLDSSRIVRRKFVVHGLENRTGDFFPFDYQGPNDETRSFFCVDYDDREYEMINIITDYFQEEERMRGRVKNANESPLEYWDSHAVSLMISELKSHHFEKLLARDVRERIFRQTKECTQFKVTLVKAVLQKLNAHRYLDMSAGWGDRLIGAIGTNSIERYVGVDPNRDLKKGHDEIISQLVDPLKRDRFSILYEPFQDVNLPPGMTFDLVFTSPPYFDFEIYSDSPSQSIQTHRSFDLWLIDFLLVSIKKSWEVLEDNGHLAIHITDTKSMKCCEIMNLFIQSRLPHSVYEGIIGSLGQRRDVVRPIWVWRKDSKNANPKRVQQAQDFLQRYHKNKLDGIEKVAKYVPPI